jgi:hypothetical protein
MMRTALRILLVLAAVSGAFAQAVDGTKTAGTLRELTSEYELAKEPHFYFGTRTSSSG